MSTKLWRVEYGIPHPVETMADNPSYPNTDASGNTIFENTHFTDKDEAWDKCIREHRAGVHLAALRVMEARRRLNDAEKSAADATIFYSDAVKAFEARHDVSQSPSDEVMPSPK